VVEHVGRAFGEDAVALRVGVGAEAEEQLMSTITFRKADELCRAGSVRPLLH
jgi:hypothetical protein